MIPILPESAPFSAPQRAWLNGFFAGLMNLDRGAAAPAGFEMSLPASPGNGAPVALEEEEDDFPWHDPALSLDERLKLAEGKPVRRIMMASLGQLDCGQCGYECKTYAEALADGSEKDLSKCVPGGKATSKKLKELLARQNSAPGMATPGNSAPGISTPGIIIPARAASTPQTAQSACRDRPVVAELMSSTPLCSSVADKQTHHVVLRLPSSGASYLPGDSLGVFAQNCGREVDAVLDALHAKPDEPVVLADGREMAAREALLSACSLKDFDEDLYGLLSAHARDDIEATRLKNLIEDDPGAPVTGLYDLLDVLHAFPSARPRVHDLVGALPKLQPRLYSISSSPRAHPDEVHLTVGVVRYECNSRARGGVASTFFAERLAPGQGVPVWVQTSHGFRLPENPDAPVIMVGPGTGIAPFRAFLEERRASGAKGPNWLFFGNQKRELDFLYREEFEAWQKEGLLTHLSLAFSRDQAQKVYVQTRMQEYGPELWRWLRDGAYFYVCGDAKRMAADVDRALVEIASTQGGMEPAAAKQFINELARGKRYLRDVY